MHSIRENIKQIQQEIGNVQLVVVSKYRKIAELEQVYGSGIRNFGENRVQEMVEKHGTLPKDIAWHAIGHLQRNKVKYIVPFVHLIHSVDSLKLLYTINNEAAKVNRTIPFLLQVHIAVETNKFGFAPNDIAKLVGSDKYQNLKNVHCRGLMAMATNTENQEQISAEFQVLKNIFDRHKKEQNWDTLSMGMSSDYSLAIQNGSTLVRIGSKIFEVAK